MNRALLAGIAIVAFVAIVVLVNTFFVVSQVEQALVLQFGRPVGAIDEPGLHAKTPFLQTVVLFDRRVLDFELPAEEVIASDQKRIVVDTYARYRIVDPLKYYQTVGDEVGRTAPPRLGRSARRCGAFWAITSLAKLLSPERDQIMAHIRDEVRDQSREFGIDVIDLRIRRADLPAENSQAIYARMVSERQREAKQFRAQGYEVAQGIKGRRRPR